MVGFKLTDKNVSDSGLSQLSSTFSPMSPCWGRCHLPSVQRSHSHCNVTTPSCVLGTQGPQRKWKTSLYPKFSQGPVLGFAWKLICKAENTESCWKVKPEHFTEGKVNVAESLSLSSGCKFDLIKKASVKDLMEACLQLGKKSKKGAVIDIFTA